MEVIQVNYGARSAMKRTLLLRTIMLPQPRRLKANTIIIYY